MSLIHFKQLYWLAMCVVWVGRIECVVCVCVCVGRIECVWGGLSMCVCEWGGGGGEEN